MKRKRKKCNKCSEEKFIFSKGMCLYCYKKEYPNKFKIKKTPLKKRSPAAKNHNPLHRNKDNSKSQLIKKIDILFSKKVKEKWVREDGSFQCISCQKILPGHLIQSGHFIPRGNMNLRWNFDNVFPQCVECNCFKNGDTKNFKLNLIQLFGIDHVENLEKQAKIIKQWSLPELQALYKTIKNG